MLVEWLYLCEKAPASGSEECALTWFIAASRGLHGLVSVYTLVFLLPEKLLILLVFFQFFPTYIQFKLCSSQEANITIPPSSCSTADVNFQHGMEQILPSHFLKRRIPLSIPYNIVATEGSSKSMGSIDHSITYGWMESKRKGLN